MPRNTAHERLKRLAKLHGDLQRFFSFAGFESPDYADERLRGRDADLALALDGPAAPYVREAFKTFGLDPRNPFHWRALLGYFAEAHFKPGRTGRRRNSKKWVQVRLLVLGMLYMKIEQDHPDWPQIKICEEIKKSKMYKEISERFPEFKKMTAKTLQRRVPAARREVQAYLARRKKLSAENRGPFFRAAN